jgi:hypothetical protein
MRHINFGITGREFQESFDPEKYIALAYQQPRGRRLQELVEQYWDAWCEVVAKAPWKTYWKRSMYWKQRCMTPSDKLGSVSSCGNVPLTVYSCAVWGFGVEEWLKLTGRKARAPVYEILKLQGVRDPRVVTQRTHMFDEKLLRGCGMQLPAEFGDLDRWLEPLWQQACNSSK